VGGDSDYLISTSHRDYFGVFSMGLFNHGKIYYFGKWQNNGKCHYSNMQYSAFEFCFKGPTVKWIGSKGPNHGYADVYIDGEFQQTVDCYVPTALKNVVKFERTCLSTDRIHSLRVVVRKDRNPNATDCYQDVTCIQSAMPVNYEAEISKSMILEYKQIQNGTKIYLPPSSWIPLSNAAEAPSSGVTLGTGLFKDAFDRNIEYLNHCFSKSPTYCDGIGWSEWLPASNEGRMLAGAGHALRWGERADMRKIVDTIISDIESRMRDDGYYNYYGERNSYALISGANSERKNYDRVFWTRGLLAAGMAGNPKAYKLLRRMYDWFNDSPYLPWMLLGGNATNGLPGGPLVYLSPVGRVDDLLVAMKYYDQDYWMNELKNKEPLCISYYPGERPHCYLILGLEALIDEYRATGARKYIDAAKGGWEIYKNNFKHVGGATAICESDGPYPPKSHYITTGHSGELCGSVFWVNVNSKLLHLYPNEEKYAAEIEESIYNVVIANQDSRGYKRYHARLHGKKDVPGCENTCCEVSSTELIARLPEFIYSISADGLYVNLYTSSKITWNLGGDDVTLTTITDFPFDPAVSMKISTPRPKTMNIRIRVPSWAKGEMRVIVNDLDYALGTLGSYLSLKRTWLNGDTISFKLPIGFTLVKYTGLDQVEGNYDRYALMYGPILMALHGDLDGLGGVPQIAVTPDDLPNLLTPIKGKPLEYNVDGYPEYKYVPYWKIDTEPFTCFPIVQL